MSGKKYTLYLALHREMVVYSGKRKLLGLRFLYRTLFYYERVDGAGERKIFAQRASISQTLSDGAGFN